MKNEGLLDQWADRLTRKIASGSGRRSFLARLAGADFGVSILPLLPVSRASAATPKRRKREIHLVATTGGTAPSMAIYAGAVESSVKQLSQEQKYLRSVGLVPVRIRWMATITLFLITIVVENLRAEDVFVIRMRANKPYTFPRRSVTTSMAGV